MGERAKWCFPNVRGIWLYILQRMKNVNHKFYMHTFYQCNDWDLYLFILKSTLFLLLVLIIIIIELYIYFIDNNNYNHDYCYLLEFHLDI